MRISRHLLLGATVVLAAGISPSSALEVGDKDGERLRRLLDGKTLGAVAVFPPLSAQPTGRILARTALPSTVLASLRRYRVELEGETLPAIAAFLDLEWSGGKGRLGVAVAQSGAVFGPMLFDDFGKPLDELDPLLAQFKGQRGVRLTEASLRPVGEVMTRRDAVMATSDPPPNPDERAAWALLRHRTMMWELERAHEALQRARAEGTSMREPLRHLVERLEELKPFASHLKGVLEPKEVGQYRRFVDALLDDAAKVRVLLDKENEPAASKLVKGPLKLGCGECHGWDRNQWKKPLEDALRTRREEAGWANGAFVVGVDLRPSAYDGEDAQRVASTVKALLLLAADAT